MFFLVFSRGWFDLDWILTTTKRLTPRAWARPALLTPNHKIVCMSFVSVPKIFLCPPTTRQWRSLANMWTSRKFKIWSSYMKFPTCLLGLHITSLLHTFGFCDLSTTCCGKTLWIGIKHVLQYMDLTRTKGMRSISHVKRRWVAFRTMSFS